MEAFVLEIDTAADDDSRKPKTAPGQAWRFEMELQLASSNHNGSKSSLQGRSSSGNLSIMQAHETSGCSNRSLRGCTDQTRHTPAVERRWSPLPPNLNGPVDYVQQKYHSADQTSAFYIPQSSTDHTDHIQGTQLSQTQSKTVAHKCLPVYSHWPRHLSWIPGTRIPRNIAARKRCHKLTAEKMATFQALQKP